MCSEHMSPIASFLGAEGGELSAAHTLGPVLSPELPAGSRCPLTVTLRSQCPGGLEEIKAFPMPETAGAPGRD